jgi:hypothetical protein
VSRLVGVPTQEELTYSKFEAAQKKLNEGIYLLRQREQVMDRQIINVGQEIRDRYGRGDKAGAKTSLKSKLSLEKSRDKTSTTRTRLEDQLDTLIQSQFNGELHRVLEECATVMNATLRGTTVTKVENTMDDLEDTYQSTKEIGDALARPMDSSDYADDEESNLEEDSKDKRLEQELEDFLATPAESPTVHRRPPPPQTAPQPLSTTASLSNHPLSGATTRVVTFPQIPASEPTHPPVGPHTVMRVGNRPPIIYRTMVPRPPHRGMQPTRQQQKKKNSAMVM